MKPLPHQEQIADEICKVIRQYAMVYVAGEERTGKTLASILAAEQLSVKNVIVITKKKPVDEWKKTLDKYGPKKKFFVTNYHQAHKINFMLYDLVILDEAHAYLSGYPKPSAMWKSLRDKLAQKPIIFLSATPSAQSRSKLYHQLQLSTWSPWRRYTSFYQWFQSYGIPRKIMVSGQLINNYDNTKDFMAEIQHLFISVTRKDVGFEHEPVDVIHTIKPDNLFTAMYTRLEKKEVIPEEEVVGDTPLNRSSAHLM